MRFGKPKYNYNDQVRKDEMGWACSINWGRGMHNRILMGKPEGKKTTRKTKT
jgi:hypothetical protein